MMLADVQLQISPVLLAQSLLPAMMLVVVGVQTMTMMELRISWMLVQLVQGTNRTIQKSMAAL
jgi:hypothetical protein